MKILCLESTAKVASVALLRDGETLAESTVHGGGRSHSELLLPMLRAVLASTGTTPEEVDLFACAAGPGSFTGVRIGVSVIKGLAFGRERPCCAVSSLEALAEILTPMEALICPVMDARRAQVYNALFEGSADGPRRLTPDRAIAADELAAELNAAYPGRPVALVGDGTEVAKAALLRAGVPILTLPRMTEPQSAAAVGRCAYRMALRGETVTDDALRPVYLRMPQAERERLARLAAEGSTENQ